MASVLQAALVEIEAALTELAPIQEGDRDFDRLNVTEQTHAAVLADLVLVDDRMARLTSAKAAIVFLLEDGYPALPVSVVSPDVTADLDAQMATIEAARTRFTAPDPAKSLKLTGGSPKPKTGTQVGHIADSR